MTHDTANEFASKQIRQAMYFGPQPSFHLVMEAAHIEPGFTSRIHTLDFAGVHRFVRSRYDEEERPAGRCLIDGGIGDAELQYHWDRLEPGAFANLKVSHLAKLGRASERYKAGSSIHLFVPTPFYFLRCCAWRAETIAN